MNGQKFHEYKCPTFYVFICWHCDSVWLMQTLDSSGVVICPHCGHYGKAKQKDTDPTQTAC